ncbi:MAG: hypothetical protein IH602_19650 [Bryobacteraceae bacterium]|nr:hypothetical protein [Bryobacteraceae bacterium]
MTMKETLKAAADDFRLHRWAPVIGVAAVAAWVGLFYYWLGLPMGSFWPFVVVVALGMVLTGGLGAMVQQSLTVYKLDDGKVGRLFGSGAFWVALIGFGVVGCWAPWVLVNWTPAVTGVAMQAVSAGVRFGLAVVLFVVTWLMLCAVVRRVMEHMREGEVAPWTGGITG